MEDPENLGSGMAGAGDSLVKQYPPATHQFLEVPSGKKEEGTPPFRESRWKPVFRADISSLGAFKLSFINPV